MLMLKTDCNVSVTV